MNKTVTAIGVSFLTMLLSCERERDERDDVTGTYSGIRVETGRGYYDYHRDTTYISMFLTKSKTYPVVEVDFSSQISYEEFKFKYHDGIFTSLMEYHPPRLTMKIDSLYFYYQPGLGPSWTECFTRKVK